jgi:hypothetical protein
LRTLLVIALTFVVNSTIFGTPQIPDFLIYKGETYPIYRNSPMGDYFEENPDKQPKEGGSTAWYRGYIAKFEIKNNELFLKDIVVYERFFKLRYWFKNYWLSFLIFFQVPPWHDYYPWDVLVYKLMFKHFPPDFHIPMYEDKWVSVLSEVFPKQKSVKFDWFSGLLVLENHEETDVYFEFEPVPFPPPASEEEKERYDEYMEDVREWKRSRRYILLEIDKGNLIRVVRIHGYDTYKKFQDKQFDTFKKTDEFKKLKADFWKEKLDGSEHWQEFWQKYWQDENNVDQHFRTWILSYTPKILIDIPPKKNGQTN